MIFFNKLSSFVGSLHATTLRKGKIIWSIVGVQNFEHLQDTNPGKNCFFLDSALSGLHDTYEII